MMFLGYAIALRNNETGLLAEGGNIEELAEKTLSVLTDNQLRKKLSLNALNYSKHLVGTKQLTNS